MWATGVNGLTIQRIPLWWALAIAGAAVISAATARSAGSFTPHHVEAIGGGLALLIAACVSLNRKWIVELPTLVWPIGVAVLATLNLSPEIAPIRSPATTALVVALAAGTITLCLPFSRFAHLLAAAVAAMADLGLAGAQITWGKAPIDVFDFTQGAAERLLRLQNPYGGVFPSTTPGVPYFHFPYLPGVLLITAPFRLLGDIRVANAVAMLILFASIWAVARRRVGQPWSERWMALGLAVPFPAYMVAKAWPEVYLVAAVAAWLALREAHPRWGTALLGLGICTVPTTLPILALPWLWWPAARREITLATLLALFLCVPFALWAGPASFVRDVVAVQLDTPTRIDALTVNSFLVYLHRPFLPTWAGILVPGLALLVAAAFTPRRWDSALLLGAVLLAVTFLMAKWAFFDYYFIVVYTIILALSCAIPSATRTGKLSSS